MGNGVGQLLMSTVVVAVKQQGCIFAIHIHPQAVSSAMYTGGGCYLDIYTYIVAINKKFTGL